jgi:hypothetical protein
MVFSYCQTLIFFLFQQGSLLVLLLWVCQQMQWLLGVKAQCLLSERVV